MQDDLAIIKRGTDEILTESDLKKKLESGKQLIVKAGLILPPQTFILAIQFYSISLDIFKI